MSDSTMLAVATLLVAALSPLIAVWASNRDAKRLAMGEAKQDGRSHAKLEAAIDLLAEFREDLKLIPVLASRMTTLENVVGHHIRTDHRELRGEIRKIEDSIHDT